MMRRLLLLAAFLLLPTLAFSQTSAVTGHILYPSGGASANGKACFTLSNYKPNAPRVSGTGVIVQSKNFCVNASSVDGSFSTTLYRNDQITPGSTYWRVDFLWNGQQESSANYNITTATYNLDSATPMVTTPLPASGLVTSSYNCQVGSALSTWTCTHNFNDKNVTVTVYDLNGAQIFPNSLTLTDANTVTLTWVTPQAGNAVIIHASAIAIAISQANAVLQSPSGSQTINSSQALTINAATAHTGNNTHSGTETFGTLNNRVAVDGVAFTTIPAAVAGCLAITNCSVVDASGIGASGSTTTFTLGSATHPMVLIMPAGQTVLNGAPSTVNGSTAMIHVNSGSAIQCAVPQATASGGVFQTNCLLKINNAINPPAVISLDGPYAALRDIIIDGNRASNPTGGVVVLINKANRVELANIVTQNAGTHGIWANSTYPTGIESCCFSARTVMSISNGVDGFFILNSPDTQIGTASQMENNGTTATVNTTNTTITATSGSWSTDASAIGTQVLVNNTTSCQVLAIPSTTTITVAAATCWNASGVSAGLGVLTGVSFNWGNGIEAKDSPTLRTTHIDIGANKENGILIWGTFGGVQSNSNMIGDGTQFGNNYENSLKIVGYDTVGGGSVSFGNIIDGVEFYPASANQTPNGTFDNIKLIDGGYNTISGVSFGSGASPHQSKCGVEEVESAAGRSQPSSISGNQRADSAVGVGTFSVGLFGGSCDATFNGNWHRQGNRIFTGATTTPATLDIFDPTAAAATPHKYFRVNGGQLNLLNSAFSQTIMGWLDGGEVQINTPGAALRLFGSSSGNNGITCNSTCAALQFNGDYGSTLIPATNFFLGTVATNNFKFQPAATSGARIITIADPLSPTTVALPLTIANGTTAMTTALIATVACGTTATTAATGVLTTDVIDWSMNAAVTAANNGLLILKAWPTAGNVNFNYCNPTAAGVTPTAMTVNWSVRRP